MYGRKVLNKFAPVFFYSDKAMQTSTIILILVVIIAVLTAVIVVLLWLMHHKDEDLKQKNDVIIHEVRRNQSIIDKAVSHGINRAALF